MKSYDEDYFLIQQDEEDDCIPSLKADKNTAARRYEYEPAPMGSAPFIFSNGFKEEFKKAGTKDKVADVLFAGATFMVRDHIREKLLALQLPGVTLHPSVYIDDSGEWHEDFWFVTIHEMFDCWDRQHSVYDPDPIEIGKSKIYSVSKYVLDSDLLDKTPLQHRLLFQLGGTLDGWVVCHKSLAPIFRQNGHSGATLTPVSEF
jgi:hypothetical protein